MKKFRGFRLGHKLVRVFKWIIRRRNNPGRLQIRNPNPVSKLCSLARSLRRGAKRLCCKNPGQGRIRLGHDNNRVGAPKGHLAVYVGGESGVDTKRVLVPVIYINHPLFEDLLKEAERVYGFDQSGGITLPCRVSEFEKVQMRIEAWDNIRRRKDRRC